MRYTWWGFCLAVVVAGSAPLGYAYPSWSLVAVRSAYQPQNTGTTGVKYNPQFGKAWQDALKERSPRRWIEAVIRLSTPPTDKDVAQLKAAGFQSRSIVHDIVTGRIRARDIKRFLKLPFVASVEGGGMGGLKKPQVLK